MPSISECRTPYLLSNLLLVTESLTLIAGNSSSPAAASWYSRSTPVVVSSVTPRSCGLTRVQYCGSLLSDWRSRSRMTPYSSESVLLGGRNDAGLLVLHALVDQQGGVATVVEQHVRALLCTSAPSALLGQRSIWSVHHQYSGSVSPFQA